MSPNKPVLVTGATGYVGGRLVARLLAAGHRVRAAGRSLKKLSARSWACDDKVELVQLNMSDRDSVTSAALGCRAAYYLVHGMMTGKNRFEGEDRVLAINMRIAAETAKLEQVIYLGGLGDNIDPRLSRHLASRHLVGQILKSGTVPATVLNAAMILGSGSASFEILRHWVERSPIMVLPKWVDTPTQPIAIANVLDYLVGCLDNPETYGQSFDIGGPEVVTYRRLIELFALEAGLKKRRVFTLPMLTPQLISLWIHLITPVPRSIARPLTEGMGVVTVCRDRRIQNLIKTQPIDCRQAISTALDQILERQVETCWSDAGRSPSASPTPWRRWRRWS